VNKYNWKEKYSVGIREIDEQHQHYFEIVNEIIETTGQKNVSGKELSDKITELNNYAIYHFTTEENLFKKYAYPGANEHTTEHRAFEERMDQFINESKKDGTDAKKLMTEIAEFAGSWLLNHVMEMDQKYVGFMHNKGIK
jgi:hemerythrin-like metal-binding protein